MPDETTTRRKIRNIVKYELSRRKFPLRYRIPLSVPTFNDREICEAIDSMLSTMVTMGDKVRQFEELFAQYVGVRYATMVNSGSSANLLAFSILANPSLKTHLRFGDEVVTPALTWSTTVFPVINIGCVPVLVDVDMETFTVNTSQLEQAISRRCRVLLPVHLLGNPSEMREIMQLAESHDLYVVEDCCEAHGAIYCGKRIGSFGDLSTFSFFFSHHITTIEGGMLLTNIERFNDLAKVMRAHGWIRELKNRELIAKRYENIDPRFLFTNIGFNLRPTEIQGAFGIHQIRKLNSFIETRRINARYLSSVLSKYSDYLTVQKERKGTRHSWLFYPITVKPSAPFTAREFKQYFESRGVETRPVMTGNFARQPVTKLFKFKVIGDLRNSDFISRNSFLIGVHQGIGKNELKYVATVISEFMSDKTRR